MRLYSELEEIDRIFCSDNQCNHNERSFGRAGMAYNYTLDYWDSITTLVVHRLLPHRYFEAKYEFENHETSIWLAVTDLVMTALYFDGGYLLLAAKDPRSLQCALHWHPISSVLCGVLGVHEIFTE